MSEPGGASKAPESDSHVVCPDPDERLIMRIERTGQASVARADVT
jgi:uncharacterized repeat protein (TIGR04076 family)